MKEDLTKAENIFVEISDCPLNKDVTVLAVKGPLDGSNSLGFEKKFRAVINDQKFKLIIDLREVPYISSSGWGLFISEIKNLRNQKGDLVLVGMNPAVGEVFELLDFNSILKAFPNIETAVKKSFKD